MDNDDADRLASIAYLEHHRKTPDSLFLLRLINEKDAQLARAEKVIEELVQAARSCARFKCTMTEDIPRCLDCGATVEGNDPVHGVCQADAIRQVRADVIETHLRRVAEYDRPSAPLDGTNEAK